MNTWTGFDLPRGSQAPLFGNQSRGQGAEVDDEMPYEDLDPANYVYHERQESSLCLRHALNSLVQREYFQDEKLGEIGCELDERERLALIGSHTTEEDVQAFYKDGYRNVRDDGFFSVEVMLHALEYQGLRAIRYNSSEAEEIRRQPENQVGYIFNLESHWFSLRRIGGKWFNLNSTFKKPRQLSNTFVSLFIAQIMEEGYSAFAIQGAYPPVIQEDLISNLPDRLYVAPKRPSPRHRPQEQHYQPHFQGQPGHTRGPPTSWNFQGADDSEFELAIQRSLQEK